MKLTGKGLLSLLLAALMCLSMLCFAACADQSDDTDEPGTQTDPEGTEGETEKEPEDPRIPLDYLPTDKTYGGATVHFLEWSANGHDQPGQGWIPWEEADVDDYDGDAINSAIYDRNAAVEEQYGVVITKEYVSVDGNPNYGTCLRSNHTSGDDAYQLATMRTTNISPFVIEGLMTNMYDQPYLHTDMPWWNQDSVRSFTLGDTLFWAAPEMLLRDKGGTASMFYNQRVAADNAEAVPNLYQLVYDGEWTMDVMIEVCENVATDLDGNDMIDTGEDMWGALGQDDPVYYLFNGAGLKFAHIDEDGYIAYDYGDEDSILIMDYIFNDIIYSDWYAHGVNRSDASGGLSHSEIFKANRALFYFNCVKGVLGMRDMEESYGILPIPKYDESQENYSSLVWVHHDCTLGIPEAVTDKEMVSIVLEHLSYLSYYDVYPIFYDTVLMGRSTRDEQSRDMLEIIFQTRSFDPGQYWDLGSGLHGGDGYLRLAATKNTNIASIWAKWEKAVNANFEKINGFVDDLG